MRAYILMRKSAIAAERRERARAVTLAAAAQAPDGKPSHLQALLFRQLAISHALASEAYESERAADVGPRGCVRRRRASEPGSRVLHSPYVLMEAGIAAVRQGTSTSPRNGFGRIRCMALGVHARPGAVPGPPGGGGSGARQHRRRVRRRATCGRCRRQSQALLGPDRSCAASTGDSRPIDGLRWYQNSEATRRQARARKENTVDFLPTDNVKGGGGLQGLGGRASNR